MALFLIFSESWQSFCQIVQQTFSMRGIYVPLVWQIYARHGKASGRTFFSDKPTVVFNDRRE